MKAFFGKIWAWVLANKVLSAIIAGGTAVVLAVAIAVPCGVSASKKRKAAQEQETQQSQSSGDQGGSQQGGEQGGGQQGGGSGDHTHSWATTWSHDATNHWHACSGCDDKNDVEAHKFGMWTIISESQEERECSTCGYKEQRAHTHTFADGWSHDETNHWHASTCGHDAKSDQAAHTPNEHGFCSVCGLYLGDQKALNSEFLVTASGTYYFTVPYSVGNHYYFCLEDNETQSVDELRAYIKVNGELVEQAHADDAMCDDDGLLAEHYPTLLYVTDPSDDLLLYVEIDEASNAGLSFNMTVSDEHLYNNVNLCVGGDHYDGLDKDLNTQINLGEFNGEHYIMGTDDTAYFRFNCYASHSYKLARNNVNANEVTFYYQNRNTMAMIELVRNGSGVFLLPGSNVFDGYVYCIISPLMQLQDAYIRLTVDGHGEPPALDDYGFCEADDVYLGTELPTDVIETGINIDSGEKAFYKFPYDAGHKYSFGDTSGEINYQWIKAYTYNNTTDDFEEILLSHVNPLNYTPFMEDEDTDGFIYLVITAGANVTNGQLDITTIHNYEHGLCLVCGDYLGTQLTLDVSPGLISVDADEHVYYSVDLADLPDNKPVLEITYTSGATSATCISSNIVTVWYLKNNVWTALEPDDWYGGNWDCEYYPTMGITTDDGKVYIDIHANHAYTDSPGFVVSAVAE